MRGKSWLAFGLLVLMAFVLPSCNDIINYPAPRIAALSPTSVSAGSQQFTLTVTGYQFTPASVIEWNGEPITLLGGISFFQSVNVMTAQVPVGLIQNPGAALISVFTQQPGGGTTTTLTFDINPVTTPVPKITAISPTGVLAGSNEFDLFIAGSNFVSESVVTINGDNRTASVISPAQIQVLMAATDVAIAGLVQISVVNPVGPPSAPGGGASNPVMLTVTNPVPTLSSISPTSFAAGSTASAALTLNGAAMVPNSVVQIDGSPRATTFVSAGQLVIQLTQGDFVAAGSHQVRVVNPSPGGGTSNVLAFAVNPTLTVGLPMLLDVGLNGAEANQGVCGAALAAGNLNCAAGPITLATAGPSISSNGSLVAFASTSTNFFLNQTNAGSDIYLRTTCLTNGSCNPTTNDVSVGTEQSSIQRIEL